MATMLFFVVQSQRHSWYRAKRRGESLVTPNAISAFGRVTLQSNFKEKVTGMIGFIDAVAHSVVFIFMCEQSIGCPPTMYL
ncbi:MAG: hypothetical protein M3N91_01095 [Pseudomonadota bacterium]|nr:hypothetical protein [Pseudomonadota bacterium]